MYPLYTIGEIGANLNLFYALFIGIAFGYIIESSGLGSSKHIAPVFYFKNLRVAETMVSAIITASTWIVIASYAGWLDFSQVFIPTTYIWPYLVGGILFGIGMIMSGWCPGTAAVGIARGKIDAGAFGLGLIVGMYLYFDQFDKIADFANSGNLGKFTIDKLLGGNIYTTGYLVTVVLAIGLSIFMNKMKKIRDEKGDD